MLRKPFWWYLLLVIFFLTTSVWLAASFWPDDNLHLVFCDVGQGDAALIIYKSSQVLVDGGPDSRVLNCLSRHMPFWDRTVELVVLTHPQADHLTGLIDVIKRYNVSGFLATGVVNDTEGFWRLREEVLDAGIPVSILSRQDIVRFDGVELRALWPEEKLGSKLVWQREPGSTSRTGSQKVLGAAYSGDLNDTSIVLQLSLNEFDILLTGDVSSGVENQLAWKGEIEVFKVAHHGSRYSSDQAFLERLAPKLAVISVGRNSFGHPTREVLGRLAALGIKTLRTDKVGDVEIISDGRSWWLHL